MKRIISLLLTLIMAMSSIPSAYAENSGDVFEITQLITSSDFQGYYSMVDIKNLTPVSQTGVLVVASYSADGKFQDSSSVGIFISGNSTDTYTVHFESKPANIQKAFILDDWGSLVPISDTCDLTVTSKKFAADTYYPQYNLAKDNQYATGYEKIRFGSTYYDFESSIDLYVNGVFFKTITASEYKYGAGLTDAQASLDWVLGNARGNITVLKSNPKECYDTIFANFYQVAELSYVYSRTDEIVLALDDIACALDDSSSKLNEIILSEEAVEEGAITVTVTRNGEKATLDSLVKGDIIAYATDFTAKKIENPKTIDIIATNATASGIITAIDMNLAGTNDNVYTIGGTEYTLVPDIASNADTEGLTLKTLVDITLDPFGRIYTYEIPPKPVNYAIALKKPSTEDDIIKLILSDGSVKIYEVDTTKATNFTDDFVTDKIDDETNVADRIVTYEVSSKTGKIINIEKIDPTVTIVDKVYKSRTGLLGAGNKILDTTPMIRIDSDAEGTVESNNSNNYEALTKNALINDTEYSGHIYRVGTTVAFVVITGVGAIFKEDSRFAVAIDTPADVLTEDGILVNYIKVLYEGEKQGLYFTPAAAEDIEIGDVFFFETDSDGYVDAVYTPTEGDPVWEDKIDADDWSYDIWDGVFSSIQFATGVVTEVTSLGMSFATIEQVESGSLDTNLDLDDTCNDGIITYWFADDCAAYTYDTTLQTRRESEKYDATSPSSIKASDFSSFDNGNGVLNDGIYAGDLMSKANIATAMIVKGEIVAIFVIEK